MLHPCACVPLRACCALSCRGGAWYFAVMRVDQRLGNASGRAPLPDPPLVEAGPHAAPTQPTLVLSVFYVVMYEQAMISWCFENWQCVGIALHLHTTCESSATAMC